jgi:hypothetical protein
MLCIQCCTVLFVQVSLCRNTGVPLAVCTKAKKILIEITEDGENCRLYRMLPGARTISLVPSKDPAPGRIWSGFVQKQMDFSGLTRSSEDDILALCPCPLNILWFEVIFDTSNILC